jgi:hypothetical protein
MMKTRRIALVVLGCIFGVAAFPAASEAIVGMGLGARVGIVPDFAHPTLSDLGIEPQDLSMYGAHATLLSVAQLSIELAAEVAYRDYQREIDLSAIGQAPALVEFGFRDYAGYATARYKLINGQFGVHLGGGLNIHRFTYSQQLPYDIPGFGNVLEIPDDEWHSGFHVLAGASFGLPMMPFRLFAEGRIAKINVSGDAARQTTFLVGATFGAF